MIELKTESQLELMRASGRLAGDVLTQVAAAVAPGITTRELDALAQRLITDAGAECSFLGYRGYPAALCVSINEEVIHGIPGDRQVLPGDIVSLDVGVCYKGYHGDTATTVAVAVSDPELLHLLDVTRRARDAGIAAVRPGARLGDVSHAVERVVLKAGFAVVRDFVGHGIGQALHEDPQVPNYGKPGRGPVLKPGMTFCIEPMVAFKSAAVSVLRDGWTVVTNDSSPSAHFEHTIAVCADGAEILTAV
ncbi:MAG: type I methionyl aminopeptidase [Lentisphaerae bacterium]|jgi:methionyl aminopeptidase|nr:type I methionyl aminopeptidase [Lentisphaerota bacterium]